MKISVETSSFIEWVNTQPGAQWQIEIVKWEHAWQVQWRCGKRHVIMGPIETRHVSRYLRQHFRQRFKEVPDKDRLPAAEARAIAWCDELDALGKQALNHNNDLKREKMAQRGAAA